jgi:hypothetical protein
MLICETQLNFMTTWNTLFKNNAYIWDQSLFMTFLHSLWRHKTAWNSECPPKVPTVMMKVFLLLNLLRSEILRRDQPGTS